MRKAIGESRIEWDGDREAAVGAVLDEIAEEYGIDESELLVVKNGTHVDHLNGASTKIAAGDTLILS